MAVKAAKQQDSKEAVSGDEQWLRDLIARNQNIRIQDATTGEDVSPDDVLAELADKQEEQKPNKDKELNAALQRGKQSALREKATLTKLQKRAEELNAAADERKERELKKEQLQEAERLQREEEKAQGKRIQNVRSVTRGVNQALERNVQPTLEKVGTLPTLGGIGLMVGILAVLLLIVVRVNAQGDTRLKQFWYMLNGRATLQGRVSPQTGSQVATGTPGTPPTPTGSATTFSATGGGGPVLNGAFRMTSDLGF